MILDLDAGNSRIKWRLLDGSGQIVGRGDVKAAVELARLQLPDSGLSLIRVCSVRSPLENTAISEWAAGMNTECRFAAVTSSFGALRNQYADSSRLGIDRWLAMIAAFARCNGACIIVDAGTALTVDVLDGSGLHRGGYILPGMGLMRDSLESNTAVRLSGEEDSHSMVPGNSTDAAVRNGINAAIVGSIEVAYATLAVTEKPELFLAGGDAPLLQQLLLARDPHMVADLVFEGLALLCGSPAGN